MKLVICLLYACDMLAIPWFSVPFAKLHIGSLFSFVSNRVRIWLRSSCVMFCEKCLLDHSKHARGHSLFGTALDLPNWANKSRDEDKSAATATWRSGKSICPWSSHVPTLEQNNEEEPGPVGNKKSKPRDRYIPNHSHTFPGSLLNLHVPAIPSLSESCQEETLGVKALGPHLGKTWDIYGYLGIDGIHDHASFIKGALKRKNPQVTVGFNTKML